MQNKISNYLKITSILAISFIQLPSQKFSLPFGIGIFLTIFERISEFDISSDLLLSLLFILGLILLFFRNKWGILTGYVLLIFPLYFYIKNLSHQKFEMSFWIPLLIFITTSITVCFYKFKKKQIAGIINGNF